MNVPKIKVGIVAVSRDCFPESLSVNRTAALCAAYEKKYGKGDIYKCPICVVESETQAMQALADIKAHGCNALCVYLGNFGPEISETMLAQKWQTETGYPVTFMAAAEENVGVLSSDRGDAFCGMLNASYNLKLRKQKAFIAEYPVGDAEYCAELLHEFISIARALVGLKNLKIFSFGPRPKNFLACNAPIGQLYNLGVEIEENSELDLFESFNNHLNDKRIAEVVKDMERELGSGNKKPEILQKLAQYELTLLDWIENNKGSKEYACIASKCWPAFQTQFGFVPCFVNGRLTGRGIPVACEVDIYGALSEYIGACIVGESDGVTLLDINNTVPKEMFEKNILGKFGYKFTDTFMGFHCGNTCSGRVIKPEMKYQKIMARSLPVEVTNGTLEGDLKDGEITLYRLQSTPDGRLFAYVAEGEILPVKCQSFGGIGIFAIPEMGRFYRHVLIENGFPHHGAVAFKHIGKSVFEVFKYLGAEKIGFNRKERYETENPFQE